MLNVALQVLYFTMVQLCVIFCVILRLITPVLCIIAVDLFAKVLCTTVQKTEMLKDLCLN